MKKKNLELTIIDLEQFSDSHKVVSLMPCPCGSSGGGSGSGGWFSNPHHVDAITDVMTEASTQSGMHGSSVKGLEAGAMKAIEVCQGCHVFGVDATSGNFGVSLSEPPGPGNIGGVGPPGGSGAGK